MRIVSWNLNRRTKKSPEIWEYLIKELDPDIALLQEVGRPPYEIWNLLGDHHWLFRRPLNRKKQHVRFVTGILTKGCIESSLTLTSKKHQWAEEIYKELFTGNIVACRVALRNGETVNVVSVHSPRWPIERGRWKEIGIKESEISQVKLKKNRDLYCTEILWALLKDKPLIGNWIVGGDLNFGLTFDKDSEAKGKESRGNEEIIERMEMLGLVDCLSQNKEIVPTFKSARAKNKFHQQLDYVYANSVMRGRLRRAGVGSCQTVFAKRDSLSDHLPVICDFD